MPETPLHHDAQLMAAGLTNVYTGTSNRHLSPEHLRAWAALQGSKLFEHAAKTARDRLDKKKETLHDTYNIIANETLPARTRFEALCAHIQKAEYKTLKGIKVGPQGDNNQMQRTFVHSIVQGLKDSITHKDIFAFIRACNYDGFHVAQFTKPGQWLATCAGKYMCYIQPADNNEIAISLKYPNNQGGLSRLGQITYSADAPQWQTLLAALQSGNLTNNQIEFWNHVLTFMENTTPSNQAIQHVSTLQDTLARFMLGMLYGQKYPAYVNQQNNHIYFRAAFADNAL